jgi:predicted dienelactone hydrolase
VFAPDHTNNTSLDGDNRTTEIYYQRAWDLSAVIDHLSTDHALTPIADPSTLLAVGHSFGGYTLLSLAGATYDMDTLEPACAAGTGPDSFCSTLDDAKVAILRGGLADDRIDAFLPMAAGDFELFGTEGLGTARGPQLVLTGELDPRADNEEIWGGLDRAGNRRGHIVNGGHQTFTDYSGILEDFEGLISAEDGFRIVNALVTAFARQTQGDDSGAGILEGQTPVSDDLVIDLGGA